MVSSRAGVRTCHVKVFDPLPGVLLSAINEKWLMSFFCSVVLGEGKSKLVSECYQIALPQSVQSHCDGGCDGLSATCCFITKIYLPGTGN